MRFALYILPLFLSISTSFAAVLRGAVRDAQNQPLGWVNVMIDKTARGTSTDENGDFEFAGLAGGDYLLRFSLIGYASTEQPVRIAGSDTLTLTLNMTPAAIDLGEVNITTERNVSGVEGGAPVRREIVSGDDVAGSSTTGGLIAGLDGETGLKTRPCAMCGSCGVGMQGLDPSYTEINVDGLPVITGLSTLYGLDGLAAVDIRRVELVKGSGSAEYGSAAIAGAMNLISVSPTAERNLKFSAGGNQFGQHNVSAAGGGKIAAVPIRASFWYGREPARIDRDADGVTDTPQFQRTNFSLGIAPPLRRGTLALNGRIYTEHRFAGEVDWSEADRGSTRIYGRDINTQRQEVSARYSAIVQDTEVRLETALVNHEQVSWYGVTSFNARQRLALANLSLEREWSERHVTIAKLGYQHQDYRDNLHLNAATDRRWNVPALVAQHTWSPAAVWTFQAGSRVEYYDGDGVVLIPRGAIGWQPQPQTTIRLSAGAGYRPVTLFSLDKAVESGFENITLDDDLAPERSTSVSFGVNRVWAVRQATVAADANIFYTDFASKAVVAFGPEANEIIYTNARRADNRGIELQTRITTNSGWGFKLGGARSDTRYRDADGWHFADLQYRYTADATAQKKWKEAGFKAEITSLLYGPQHLPEGRSRSATPAYVLWDAQAAKSWGHFEISLAVKNIFDWTQSDNPYPRDPDTGRLLPDAVLMYGPLIGRTFHAGLTYIL